jgi:hypothetical protein
MIPPPAPTAAPKPKSKGKKGEGVVISKKGNQPTEFHPLNSDQQAIQMSLGFAERGSNGDLIHTVKGEHETFSTIAQWYTGSANNAAELAKVNALGVNDPLALETRITVPLKLVRNFKVMAPGN